MSRSRIPDEDRKELRRNLDQIAGNTPEDTAVHCQRVEALNQTVPHTIKHLETRPGDRSDCMIYALEIPFGLVNVAATMNIQVDFVTSGLPRFLEEIPDSETSNGRVVLYFKEGEPTHLGLMKGDRVISKWGRNPVYEHSLAEVPTSYGDAYQIFNQPSACYITNKFIEFVRQHPRYPDIREIFEEFVTELAG